MIRNGKASSSRRTRHFDIKYFNMRDKMKLNGIEVVYCPTEKMVADFFTKPLQGSLFRMMRRIVMVISSLQKDFLFLLLQPSLLSLLPS